MCFFVNMAALSQDFLKFSCYLVWKWKMDAAPTAPLHDYTNTFKSYETVRSLYIECVVVPHCCYFFPYVAPDLMDEGAFFSVVCFSLPIFWVACIFKENFLSAFSHKLFMWCLCAMVDAEVEFCNKECACVIYILRCFEEENFHNECARIWDTNGKDFAK